MASKRRCSFAARLWCRSDRGSRGNISRTYGTRLRPSASLLPHNHFNTNMRRSSPDPIDSSSRHTLLAKGLRNSCVCVHQGLPLPLPLTSSLASQCASARASLWPLPCIRSRPPVRGSTPLVLHQQIVAVVMARVRSPLHQQSTEPSPNGSVLIFVMERTPSPLRCIRWYKHPLGLRLHCF